MTTDDAKTYLSKRRIPSLFESLMTGLMYHRPEDHIQYLRDCLEKVQDKGQDQITWSSFVDFKKARTPLPPINNGRRKSSSKGSRPSSKTRAITPKGKTSDSFDAPDQGKGRVPSPEPAVMSEEESTLSRLDAKVASSVAITSKEEKTPREPETVAAPSAGLTEKISLNVPVCVMMGAPGSGKRQQVKKLLTRYDGWVQLSMGDLIRAEIKDRGSGHAKWRMTRELLSRGEAAPEDVIGPTLFAALKKIGGAKGVIISGFPRSLQQVAEFDRNVGRVDIVFMLDCEEQTTTDRLLRKGKESRRPEDTLTAIASRLSFFKNNTLAAARHYDEMGKLCVIDAEKSTEEVEQELGKAFDNLFYSKYGTKPLEAMTGPPPATPPGPAVYKKKFEKEDSNITDKPLFIGAVPPVAKVETTDEGRKPGLPACPIIFVAGAPGSGKGTQCQKIVNRYTGFVHLSMGDILRQEISTKGSADEKWDMITKLLQKGDMAPDDVTVDLLKESMKKHPDAKCFVIEGFPREKEQVENFNKHIGGLNFAVLFDCDEYYCVSRLQKRGKEEGRIDDNLAAVANKIEFYKYNTLPVLKYYDDIGKLVVLNSDKDEEELFYDLSKLCDFAFFGQKPDEESDEELSKAASKIQAGFRGFKVRKEVASAKSKRETKELITDDEKMLGKPITYLTETPRTDSDLKKKERQEKLKAAEKIQAGYRGFKARQELNPQHHKKELVERGKDGDDDNGDIGDDVAKAATKIQSTFRGYKVRKEHSYKKTKTGQAEPVSEQEEGKGKEGIEGEEGKEGKEGQEGEEGKEVVEMEVVEEVVEATIAKEEAVITGETIDNPDHTITLEAVAQQQQQEQEQEQPESNS